MPGAHAAQPLGEAVEAALEKRPGGQGLQREAIKNAITKAEATWLDAQALGSVETFLEMRTKAGLVVTYLMDKGAPVKIPVPAPDAPAPK